MVNFQQLSLCFRLLTPLITGRRRFSQCVHFPEYQNRRLLGLRPRRSPPVDIRVDRFFFDFIGRATRYARPTSSGRPHFSSAHGLRGRPHAWAREQDSTRRDLLARVGFRRWAVCRFLRDDKRTFRALRTSMLGTSGFYRWTILSVFSGMRNGLLPRFPHSNLIVGLPRQRSHHPFGGPGCNRSLPLLAGGLGHAWIAPTLWCWLRVSGPRSQ